MQFQFLTLLYPIYIKHLVSESVSGMFFFVAQETNNLFITQQQQHCLSDFPPNLKIGWETAEIEINKIK